MTVLVENEGCCKIVDEFDRMSKRRTFRVNAGKSKVIHCMVFEEQESKSSILQSYRFKRKSKTEYMIRLEADVMEEVI